MAGVDKSSPVPYYHQLKEALVAQIKKERCEPGDRLWSENDLCAKFAVSRSVVRQALASLEIEGVVERIKGRGTFLAPRRGDLGLAFSTSGLHAHVKDQGGTLTSQVRSLELEAASERIAGLLALPVGAEVMALDRVRAIDGRAWVHTRSWIPAELVPGIEAFDFSTDSLYRILQEEYHLVFGKAWRSVSAMAASPSIAHLLHTDEGTPTLRIESVLFASDGKPIETFIASHRGDLSRFEVFLNSAAGEVGATLVDPGEI